MKKTFLILAGFLLAVQVYAGSTAIVIPEVVAASANNTSLNFTFSPYYGDGWLNGKVSILVPEGFYPEPLTITPYSGQVTAVIMRGSTGAEPVPAADISTDGKTVIISGLTFGANDYMIITYGVVDTGSAAYGLNTPMVPGEYIFSMQEAPLGSAFIPLSSQPKVTVNNLVLTKSAGASTASAGLTFTYTLNVSNLSAVHQLESVRVWDSLPPGIKPIGSNLPFSVQTLTYVSWDVGSLLYSANLEIQLYCEVQTGIRTHGAYAVNIAEAYAKDMYAYEYSASAEAGVIASGPVLGIAITAAPGYITLNQQVTVIMTVSNSGNGPATYIIPDADSGSAGSADVLKMSGPLPSVASSLNAASSAAFTWVYKATTTGEFWFTGSASAVEAGRSIEIPAATSNIVVVNAPTATATADPTLTVTVAPVFTATITKTATAVITATNTPVIDLPTRTPIVIPESVSGGNVYTDKNYIRQDNGEWFRIYYEAPDAGKLEIMVFNLSGERIRYFSREYSQRTKDYMDWDGKNEVLKNAGKGIYFILVKMGKWQHMKKVVILK